ncbi:hypothetical protein VNO77_07949 [Canavalia gladiata]|uniref:Uncharacterized protein n=1 Tax=Canavalia gladiata TaxID=3824 RepID=A0AAN9M8Z3_CANGL
MEDSHEEQGEKEKGFMERGGVEPNKTSRLHELSRDSEHDVKSMVVQNKSGSELEVGVLVTVTQAKILKKENEAWANDIRGKVKAARYPPYSHAPCHVISGSRREAYAKIIQVLNMFLVKTMWAHAGLVHINNVLGCLTCLHRLDKEDRIHPCFHFDYTSTMRHPDAHIIAKVYLNYAYGSASERSSAFGGHNSQFEKFIAKDSRKGSGEKRKALVKIARGFLLES